MQAKVGDRLHVHGRHVGNPDKSGRIVEVRGTGGSPPYVVRFDDGHQALVFPGPDAIVEAADTDGDDGGPGAADGVGPGAGAGAGAARQ